MMAFLLGQCANAIRKTERVGKPCDSPPQELITSLLSSSKPSPYQRSDIDTPSSLRACHVDLAFSPPARVESDPPARNVCGLDDGFESADINEAVSRRSEGRASRARVVDTVMARNAIFVLLVGGINSDLPGPILAQVRTGLSKAT